MLIRLLIILSLVYASASLAVSEAKERMRLAGSGRAIDGETLIVGSRKVDLFAITAPTPHQIRQELTGHGLHDYVRQSRRTVLASLLAGRQIECVLEMPARKDASATVDLWSSLFAPPGTAAVTGPESSAEADWTATGARRRP